METPNEKIRIIFNVEIDIPELKELIRSTAVDIAKGAIAEIPDVFAEDIEFKRTELEDGFVAVTVDWV